MKQPQKQQTMGASIRQHMESKALSFSKLTIEVCHLLPRSRWVTDETIRRYASDKVAPEKADPVLVSAMAEVFGCRVADLSETVAKDMLTIKELLSHCRCSSALAREGAGTRPRNRGAASSDRTLASAVA